MRIFVNRKIKALFYKILMRMLALTRSTQRTGNGHYICPELLNSYKIVDLL